MKDEKKGLSFDSENLAVPEVHVDENKVPPLEGEPAPEGRGDIAYDTLAIPEYRPKKKK